MNCINQLYTIFQNHPQVSTDSRQVSSGSIFFALKGENFDGNRYAARALDAGASVAVVDDPSVAVSERYVLVEEVLQALQALALYHRRKLGLPILAITGSNGKTTTKELVGRTLSQRYRVAVTHGNLNNHIGVPLTLLAMSAQTQFGVVEMGANHCGEIALLCRIAEPNYGLITNIGLAHLEGFGGPEGVMRGKGELLDYLLAHQGEAFYLRESEALCKMVAMRPELHTNAFTADDLMVLSADAELRLQYNGETIHSRLVGSYNTYNIAAALAVGTRFGVDTLDAVRAIESYVPDNNRSQRQVTAHNCLILDAYNANPSSMRAALENFAAEDSTHKVVVLGDMRELGVYAAAEHTAIVCLLQELDFSAGYLVGACFSQAVTAASAPYLTFSDVDALRGHLSTHPLRDATVLVKGSRGIGLERVIDLL